ncbi:MAG: GNAT family N-acetyltransferase, partial [Methanobrevibacter sp.]|nr:GNAT family N-acetyltransferase [Methanobrevibacter sp.]
MKGINFKKIIIELHDGSKELSKFDCGHDGLNEFLKIDSIKQNECMFNSTYLAIYNNETIGFFTLLTDRIKIKDLEEQYQEKFKNKVSYNFFPAIKIGRLGVSSLYRKKGVGSYLLQMIFFYGVELSKKVGFRFVTIDVYISAYDFYKKNFCKDSFNK